MPNILAFTGRASFFFTISSAVVDETASHHNTNGMHTVFSIVWYWHKFVTRTACVLAWRIRFVNGSDLQQQRMACKYCKIGSWLRMSFACRVGLANKMVCTYFWHYLALKYIGFLDVTLTSRGAGRNRSGNSTCIHDVLNADFTIWSNY